MKRLFKNLLSLVSSTDKSGGAVIQHRELCGHHHEVMIRTYFLLSHKL